MNENELFKNIREVMLKQLNNPNVEVKRAYQATQQGADANPTVYFHLISQTPYGFLSRNDVLEGGVMWHIEKQFYETVIQFSAIAEESPTTVYRSVDLINDAWFAIQRDDARLALRDRLISILRVMDIRQLYVTDNQGRYQSYPSFDLTVITQTVRKSPTPTINTFQFDKYRI